MQKIILSLYYIISFCTASAQSLLEYVDTRVGTAVSITKSAGVFGNGTEEYAHTIPAVLTPYGMNFWTPQTRMTEQKGVCPYMYCDSVIQGFRCSHWIVGGCTQDYGSFTVSPSNSIRIKNSTFIHEREVATPSYYSVRLDDIGVFAEMTATKRAGIMRFTYDNPDSAYLFITTNSDEGVGNIQVSDDGVVTAVNPAHRIYQGWGEPTGHAGHFLLKCNALIEKHGRVDSNTIWVKFAAQSGPVVVKAANSFVSFEGSQRNLETEIPDFDFDLVRKQLDKEWERKLSQIMVCSDNKEDLAKFYGSIYRTSFLPHDISDVDGVAPVFSGKDEVKSVYARKTYDDFSMWDTYRAQHPLLTIIESSESGLMMQSLVNKYIQGGWLPIFPCWNSYTAAMIGDHCISAIVDAYVKDCRNFQYDKAYEAMRKNAFEVPSTFEEYKNGMGRRALQSYLEYGYIPLEDSVKEAFHQNEQVSRTLEYAYDDYVLAQMSRILGKKKDYKELMKRSRNYKKVFDQRTGWVNGRHADGRFANEDDIQYIKEPEKHPDARALTPTTFSTFITEGTPVHYSWYVPHDIKGLVKCMGGRKSFEAKLDSMFERGWYWHGNEPCHQIPYMYSAIGKVEKTARVVKHIMETEYLNAPGGLSGNDDAGQMSAWYIFSSLGFYPICPGTNKYYLGCPAFKRMDIRVDDKNFTIMCDGVLDDSSCIGEIKLNGKKLKRSYITHEEIMNGGVLEFEIVKK